MLTIAAAKKHLGARIGITAMHHTWGSALTHHPHVHMIVPGGAFSLDGERFIPCRRGFFLPVRVLSRLFRRLMLEKLAAAHGQGRLILQGRECVRRSLEATAPEELVRVRQAPLSLCWAEGCSCLSVALQPPGGHLERAALRP
jgi:hypothetical protein